MELSSIQWDMILGGFGLFMFGIEFMGSGLKSVAGDRMRTYIDRYTSKPWSAMLIGFVITVLMQSSSASTAITIGLVRAGLMTLSQAAGIILGANIGSTFTALLISLNIGKASLYIVFAGCMLICFSKKRKIQYMGNVLLGFGLIFYGLSAMGDSLTALKDLPEFSAFALKMSNSPALSLGTGIIMTMIVQSSAATIGVIQKLFDAGAITLSAALPFIFGANIGTTITGILAAMGGSLSARRTACMHTVFNIFACIGGMLLRKPYTALIVAMTNHFSLSPMMEIAFTNITFNSAAALILFPFLKQFVALICRIIPGEEPQRPQIDINSLDASLALQLPAAAIFEAEKAMEQMVKIVHEDIKETRQFFNSKGTADDKQMLDQEESLINNCDKRITDFLISVSMRASIPPSDKEDIRINLETVKNLERIGDLAMNLEEFYLMVNEDNGSFSANAMKDINSMYDYLSEMLDQAWKIHQSRDDSLFPALMVMEAKMDALEVSARNAHFVRMEKGECNSAVAGSVFTDILATLERMGDHCVNIATSALSAANDPDKLKHNQETIQSSQDDVRRN